MAWTAASTHAAGLAPDQVALSVAWAHDIDFYDVGLVWELPVALDLLKRNDVTVRLSADVANWQSGEQGADVTSLWDFSLTPLLRWSPPGNGSPRMFLEGGIGVHLLSHTQINYKHFSTAFQFGERVALGLAFGSGDRFEVAGYVQHVSNADIEMPNDGMTQYGVMVRLRLE